MALDERLRRELDQAARPADPSGLYEHLIRRRERRRIAKRVQSGLLAVVVLLGSVGGFYALTRIFGGSETPDVATPSGSSGEIVFSIPLQGEGEALMAVARDGSGLRRLTPEGRADYRSPDVSPDGRTVVVVHSIPSFENEQAAVLATVPIEGGSPTWLTDTPQIVLDPVWSPDGRSIAFAGEVPGGPFGLYVLDVDTGDTYLIPGTDNMLTGDPTWSPDGDRLAFEGAAPEPFDDGSGVTRDAWDIYSVGVDGSGLMNLTRTSDESELWPAWSWATDRIAFVRGVPRGSGVFTMASDGSDETLVFDALPNLGSPAWSPDGTMIAFAADTGQVYTVGADGTDLRPVTGALGEPAWQAIPRGETVVPTPTPSTDPSPSPVGDDIGLGFPVCDVTSVRGEFEPGVTGAAFVGTRMGDTGGCPRHGEGSQVLAVDLSGDGLAEVSFGPLDCEQWCSAFAAPDVDGDGNDELLVQNVEFTIVGLKLFEVMSGDEPTLVAVTVAQPGDAPFGYQGFEAGEEPQFWIGGDAFSADALRCESGAGGRLLISTTGESLPHDSPDATWFATETTFDLDGGELRVLSVREYETSLDDLSPFVTTGCGADLDAYG